MKSSNTTGSELLCSLVFGFLADFVQFRDGRSNVVGAMEILTVRFWADNVNHGES